MVGQLENALSLTAGDGGRVWKTLSTYLEEGGSLHRLRAVSHGLHDLVDREPGEPFRRLCINAPLAEDTSMESLMTVAPFCHDLTIKVNVPDHGSPHPPAKAPLATSPRNGLSDWFPRANLERSSSLWWRRKQRRGGPRLELDHTLSSVPRNAAHAQASKPSASPPISHTYQRTISRRLWAQILSHFRQLRAITLCINGDPAWPGRTVVEDLLVNLRIALESAGLENVRSFSLNPVHAMGIVHLRWDGLGAFGGPLSSSAALWMRIENLELSINNYLAATTSKDHRQLMFKKILYEYLRSFAPTLCCLRFIWLGGEGPNPLGLHHERGLENRPGIKWPRLEELWLGNLKMPNQTMNLVREFAQARTKIMILRSTQRDSSMEVDDATAWVEVLEGENLSLRSAAADRDSSVYSQDDPCVGSEWEGGISRSSQDLTIMFRQ